jgi:4'-phosphopantetheinyl transferase
MRDQVHLWRACLDLPGPRLAEFAEHLAPDERARAARFHFERDRARFTAARGLLRTLLGRYLHRDPKAVRFRYQAFGKPELADGDAGHGRPPLRFNLSHSHGLALIAVTWGRAVGVDVEQIRDIGELDAVLTTAFSSRECAALQDLDPEQRRLAFFRGWVCKEAFVKATGAGMSQSPSDVEVAASPGCPARFLAVNGDPDIAARWSLQELWPAGGAVAAVVVEGPAVPLRLWEWPHADPDLNLEDTKETQRHEENDSEILSPL